MQEESELDWDAVYADQAPRVYNYRWGSGMVEVKYSYQAIILVRSKLYGALPLSPRDIYLALAKTVPDPA
ncbi:MAG TPA: hypothetical protein VN676_17690, partial [Steroidobacteraceae bacterium]|nr:hypothetical protein [Steroidobacteraceae bacterium]